MKSFVTNDKNIHLFNTNAIHLYEDWPTPVTIISDGPYGVGGFRGDPHTSDQLDKWYSSHIEAWSRLSTPQTTLWFWNSEHGWANVHPLLVSKGWEYVNCHVWDKGIEHIAGNSNTKTLRQFPIVSELCVQYVRRAEFFADGKIMSMQEWLRQEWKRTGLPFSRANEACGVKDAAVRKYLTADHLWYYPPPDAFEKLAEYANRYGDPKGRPYFSINGSKPITSSEWAKLRSKFFCPHGVTNIWRHPPLNGKERIKAGTKAFHLNQKPLRLMKLIIEASTEEGDTIWEPFGGLCSGAVAARALRRKCYIAEIDERVFSQAIKRIKTAVSQITLEF